MAKTIKTVLDDEVTLKGNEIFVSYTDSFLSGWGGAEGRTHKQVTICENWEEAQKLIKVLRYYKDKGGFKYINSSDSIPRFEACGYSVSYRKYYPGIYDYDNLFK